MEQVESKLLDVILNVLSDEGINPQIYLRDSRIRRDFSALRSKGVSYKESISKLANQHNLKGSTIEGIIC